jgi:deoxyribodipyrimidine photo-lyase
MIPDSRIRLVNDRPVRPNGRWVVYWMLAARRLSANFALDRAVGLSEELRRPLIILEALACDYPWASERLHHFVLDGMRDHGERVGVTAARYYPYVEQEPGDGRELLAALADEACAVVTDDYPAFILPRIVEAAGAHLPVALEAVDANGLLPMRSADRAYPTAYAFRRFLQRELPAHLEAPPRTDPLGGADLPALGKLPADVLRRWPPASDDLLAGSPSALADLPIDHDVRPVATSGGSVAGRERLRRFVEQSLERYEQRNHPDMNATSGLSPYLHFGHIGAHEVFDAVVAAEEWTPDRLAPDGRGQRAGWWGMSAAAEAFLDELVTWRELGFNAAAHLPDYERYGSLPKWARTTLEDHAADPREHRYSLKELAAAETHDEVWNAAQRELLEEGSIHGYLRMLWGKKILEWTASPREALGVMVELNDRFALDGRDPNSYSGIMWVLGRYDRAWGPERPVFGKVRYMSSEQARKKLRMRAYLERFGAAHGERDSTGSAPRMRRDP